MKSRCAAWQVRAAAALLLCGVSTAGFAAETLDPARRAERVDLLAQDQRRWKHDLQRKRAAEQVKRSGDREYRRLRYADAARSYRDAYPNFPQPSTLIMASDAHLRALLRANRQPAESAGGCTRSVVFADDLAGSLWNGFDTAFDLATRTGDRRFIRSSLYARAKPMASCLHALATHSAAQPATACIDVAALDRCLGAPIIR